MEISNRELDGTLYLALHLAKKGMPTLLGERMVHEYLFRLHDGAPVIYFDSDLNPGVGQRVLDSGGRVFNLSSEGLVKKESLGLPGYTRFSDTVTGFCAWGEAPAETIRSALPAEKASLVKATGYPSFDLLSERFHPYYASEEIVRAHGKNFIMVNTNFSLFNLKMSLKKYMKMLGRMKEWKVYNDSKVQSHLMKGVEHEGKMFAEFRALIRALAQAFPDRHVVVRPHPMEGHTLYKGSFRDLDNVFVDSRGPVRRWIESAAVVVHHDCTTGAEALLMNKLVIGYRPFINAAHSCSVMSRIGVQVTTVEEAIQVVREGRMPEDQYRSQLDVLRPYFSNLEQNSAESIASYVAQYADPAKVWTPRPLGAWESFKCWRKYASKLLRCLQPGHNGRKVRYALEKFPRLPFAEVQSRVERMRVIEPDLPRVRLTSLALNTFLIEPDEVA
jgi:surface carbohydrate biosynthesis protein